MLKMRQLGVYRQYILSGVSIYNIMAYNFTVDFIFTLIFNMGFFALTPIYEISLDGSWSVLLLASVVLPIYNIYYYITTEG